MSEADLLIIVSFFFQELLTGKVPYDKIEDDGPVMKKIVSGVMPEEPEYEDSGPRCRL